MKFVKKVLLAALVLLSAFAEGKSAVPYDYEVEYISSVGSRTSTVQVSNGAYIDTGITPDYDTGFDIVMSMPKNVHASQSYFGCCTSTWTDGYGLYYGHSLNNLPSVQFAINSKWSSNHKLTDYTLHATYDPPYFTSNDGWTGHISRNTTQLQVGSFCLLGNRVGAVVRTSPVDLHSFKFFKNGVLLQHLIPVVKSGEGMMYDRVSGQLFRNAGTGAFVVGPRKSDSAVEIAMGRVYTARDYVQNGLVAIWDGIENAGWNKHDPNATRWKQLLDNSGAYDLVVPSNKAAFTDDSLVSIVGNPSLQTVSKRYFNGWLEGVFKVPSILQCYLVGFENPQGIAVTAQGYVTFSNLSKVGYTHAYEAGVRFNVSGSNLQSTNYKMYYNGNVAVDIMTVRYFASAGKWFYNAPAGTEVCCVRHYNRELTEEEIRHNYEIDRIRFNLP